jgi:hypothetical protein
MSNILLDGLDKLAEPDTLNKLTISIIKSHNEDKNSIKKNESKMSQVQLLKHWCQMNGCIYKSIQVPTLKDLIENNELLHFFISYLNSINSISILQLFLTLSKFLE